MLRPLPVLRLLVSSLALLPLAACDSGKSGSSITLNTSDSTSETVAKIDGSGAATIDTPFFKGKVQIPKIKLDAANFDMNGVHLYPGSTISGMNIDSHKTSDGDGDKTDDAKVRVTFTSPATPVTVRDWFKGELTDAGFSVAPKGDGLSGKTDDDKPFRLDLTPDGGDKANGVITIG